MHFLSPSSDRYFHAFCNCHFYFVQWTMDGKKKKKKAKTVSKKTQRKSVVESSESESEAGEIKSEPEEGNLQVYNYFFQRGRHLYSLGFDTF